MQTLAGGYPGVRSVELRPEVASRLFGLPGLIFLVAHAPLSLGMYLLPQMSTLHITLTFGLAVLIALKCERPESILCVCGYIAGAEVLWRMTEAEAFLHAKYSIVLLSIIGLVRFRSARFSVKPLVYLLFLIPSMLVTFVVADDIRVVRGAIAFNVSGALVMAVCACFCSRLWISPKQLQRIFFFTVAPIIGIWAISLYATATTTHIKFAMHSNWETSAGYNPTYVSAPLGLGGLLCYLLFLMNFSAGMLKKTVIIIGFILLTVQSTMTFSRGGIYMEFGAAAVASYYLFRSKFLRAKLLLLAVFLIFFTAYLIVPTLDSFTKGRFSMRFTDTNPTRRDTLVMDDVRTFFENPLVGVGPGRAKEFRSIGQPLLSHTEYSRLLSEHGIFGLVSLFLLVVMIYDNWRTIGQGGFYLLAVMAWGLLFFAVLATRIALPCFFVALSFMAPCRDELNEPETEEH
jgi:hypothetical protein